MLKLCEAERRIVNADTCVVDERAASDMRWRLAV